MPHELKYRKTREGYILEIEEKTGFELSRPWKKANIAQLHEVAELMRVYPVETVIRNLGIKSENKKN